MYSFLWLALGLGCSGSKDTTTAIVEGDMYTLVLEPVTAPGQEELLDQAEQIGLIIDQGDGTRIEVPLTEPEDNVRGGTRQVPALEDAILTFVGVVGTEVLYYGRTAPISVSTGYRDVQVFVAEADTQSELDALSQPSSLAPLVATGDGRFFLFGGASGGLYESPVNDTIYSLDLVNIIDSVDMQPVSVPMPSTGDGLAGRIGHTATALATQDGTVGRILITGGSAQYLDGTGAFVGHQTATKSSFLFDPTDESINHVDELTHRRFGHQALLNTTGQVVVFGGWMFGAADVPSTSELVETFDPSTNEWDVSSDTLSAGAVFQSQALLGEQGILVCGGVATDMTYTDACDLIVNNGVLEEGPALPSPLSHASMATLPDGRVLLTGGLDTTDAVFTLDDTPRLEANRKAWVTDGTDWEQVGSMHNQRAMHTSVPLADGRILIVGGVTGIDPDEAEADDLYSGILYDAALAIACGEIYDPETEQFNEVQSCTDNTAVATLPERTLIPQAATDPIHGTVIAGGIGVDEGKAVDGLLVYRLGLEL